MTSREIFLAKLRRKAMPRPAMGSATSIVTTDLMDKVGVAFPDAHVDAEKMAVLAAAGVTELGFDNVMPLFSVWHESAALGCRVDWGARDRMPACGQPLCADLREAVRIPADFLKRPACATPLAALRLLQKRLGCDSAVVGKVFGPWTLGYHVYGIENFLIATLLEPDTIKRVLRELLEVTLLFGRAQLDAGADALTLGDHATSDLCSPQAYRDFLLELHAELVARLDCPLILHICGNTADRIGDIRRTGVACFHFDSKVPAPLARELAGEEMALMGGTGNLDVIRRGTPEQIQQEVAAKLAAGIDIIGPECAVPLDAPCRNLRRLADAAKAAPSSLA